MSFDSLASVEGSRVFYPLCIMDVHRKTYPLRFIPLVLIILFGWISYSSSSVLTSTCFPEVTQDCDTNVANYTSLNSSVKYYFFTRKNPKTPELLHDCNDSLPRNTNFNPKHKLIAVIGGFVNGVCQLSFYMDIRDEFLKKGDYNVLLIDPRDAYGFNYLNSVSILPMIAKEVAHMFENIQDQTGIKNDLIYLVGHSLGAQLCGLITNYFRVKRITGIDPAGVLFAEHVPRDLRLDDTDAELVDILHCNGGDTFPTFSLDYPTGDVDFYINGGKHQPSCSDIAMKAAKELDFLLAFSLYVPSACAHFICPYYYLLSINNENGPFKARACDSYAHFLSGDCHSIPPVSMGVDFDKKFYSEMKRTWPRKYYVDTSKHWPYVVREALR